MKLLQKDNERLDRKAEEAVVLRKNLTKLEKFVNYTNICISMHVQHCDNTVLLYWIYGLCKLI